MLVVGLDLVHKNASIRIQELPAFVAINTAGDVQTSHQKYQFFGTRNKSVNYPEVSVKKKISSCVTLAYVEKLF